MELTSISNQALTATNSTAQYELGDFYVRPDDGSKWVYSQASAAVTATDVLSIDQDKLSVTNVIVGAGTPTQTTHLGRIYSYLQVLDKTSGFGTTVNQYKGYRGVMVETGEAFEFDTTTANAGYLKDCLSDVTPTSLKAFHPDVVLQSPAGVETNIVGVALVDCAADSYFWRQTKGIAKVTVASSSDVDGNPVVNAGSGKCRVIRPNDVGYLFVIGQFILGSKVADGTAWIRLIGFE